MKKIILFILAAITVYSCLQTEDVPSALSEFSVVPQTYEAFAGDPLPVLALKSDSGELPDGEAVTWTSSHPDIVSVAPDGSLKFVVRDIEGKGQVVTIAAEYAGYSSSMKISVKGQILKYNIIDMKEDLGFSILDRNVGALDVSDPGHYFQWGKNEPVTVKTLDPQWSASSPGFSDWSRPGNSPCPKGWEPMSSLDKNSFMNFVSDVIYDYEKCLEDKFPSNYTKAEYEKACSLWKTMNFIPAGYIQASANGQTNVVTSPDRAYIWTGVRSKDDPGKSFYIERATAPKTKVEAPTAVISTAMSLRCVKTDKYKMRKLGLVRH